MQDKEDQEPGDYRGRAYVAASFNREWWKSIMDFFLDNIHINSTTRDYS